MPFLLLPLPGGEGSWGRCFVLRLQGKAWGKQDPAKHPSRSPRLRSALKHLVVPSRAVGTEALTVIPGTRSLGHFSAGQGNSRWKRLSLPEQLLETLQCTEDPACRGEDACLIARGQSGPAGGRRAVASVSCALEAALMPRGTGPGKKPRSPVSHAQARQHDTAVPGMASEAAAALGLPIPPLGLERFHCTGPLN